MKPGLRTILLTILTLAIAYSGGYFFGAYPDSLKKYLPGSNQEITLGTYIPEHFSENLLILIYEMTGVEVRLKKITDETQILQNDLIFVSASEISLEVTKPIEIEDFSAKLYPDFQDSTPNAKTIFPIGWKLNTDADKRSRIEILYFLGLNPQKKEAIRKVIDFFSEPQFHKVWLRESGLNSTLAISVDWPADLESQKASQLRNYPLSQIDIDHF